MSEAADDLRVEMLDGRITAMTPPTIRHHEISCAANPARHILTAWRYI